jgi:hypothetical protein
VFLQLFGANYHGTRFIDALAQLQNSINRAIR